VAALPASADKARFVRDMFDAIASRYDLMNRLMTGGQDERWRQLTAEVVYPEAVGVALDLGAGTGDLSLALARRAPFARVIALDFSANMLERARRKAAESREGSHVLPVLGDAMRLPFKSASIDAVVTGFTLRNVEDVGAVFGECARVLSPGGRVGALELTPVQRSPIPGFRRLFDLYFGRVVPLLGGAISGQEFAYRYLPSSVRVFPDADRLVTLLRNAGLTGIACRLLALGTVAVHTATKPLPGGEAAPSAGEDHLSQREVSDAREWNETLAALPNAHLLQTWQWAELKRDTGWLPHRIVFERDSRTVAAASVSIRRFSKTPFVAAYCQKGPALDYADAPLLGAVLRRLADLARTERCIFLKLDPDVEWHQRAAVAALRDAGYVPAAEQVQTRSTVLVDLRGDDKELQRRMSATWRRYVNKAQRDGVVVRAGTDADVPRFFELMQDTERRQGYVIRPLSYYRAAFEQLHTAGIAELFLGEVDATAEAAVFACRLGPRAWYLYGGASPAGLKSHAAQLLQWHTMRWARDAGCDTYDMWGAPDDPEDRGDPLAGVYFFKRGFGGRHVRMAGVYDYVISPALYALWERALPRYIALLRRLSGRCDAVGGAAA
jgi:ubiquinone/menaquinone biosynthesis methyltransferase